MIQLNLNQCLVLAAAAAAADIAVLLVVVVVDSIYLYKERKFNLL